MNRKRINLSFVSAGRVNIFALKVGNSNANVEFKKEIADVECTSVLLFDPLHRARNNKLKDVLGILLHQNNLYVCL